MHIKSLSQGLPCTTLYNQDLNQVLPDPEAKCLPLDHDVTKYCLTLKFQPTWRDPNGNNEEFSSTRRDFVSIEQVYEIS